MICRFLNRYLYTVLDAVKTITVSDRASLDNRHRQLSENRFRIWCVYHSTWQRRRSFFGCTFNPHRETWKNVLFSKLLNRISPFYRPITYHLASYLSVFRRDRSSNAARSIYFFNKSIDYGFERLQYQRLHVGLAFFQSRKFTFDVLLGSNYFR